MESQEQAWAEAMRAERAGNEAVYGQFLEAFAAFLRRIIRHRLGHLALGANEVEDVVQEVLIAVHSRRRQWDSRRPLLPWLNAIARYKMIDALRLRRKELSLRIDLAEDEWSSLPGTETEEAAVTPEELDRLVSDLPPAQSSVVRAIAVEGLSPREAAKRLGMREGAVRVAFHRSLKRLRQAAQKWMR